MASLAKHVVADSGAFLRNAQLKDIGETIYTISEVIGEIKDTATKQRLQVLPYELKLKEPSPEAIKIVTEFSKKTGDYRSLSAADIKVMALTYQLEKENVGTDHLKECPSTKTKWTSSKSLLDKPTKIAGFYLKDKKPTTRSRNSSQCSQSNIAEVTNLVKEVHVIDENTEAISDITESTGDQATSSDIEDSVVTTAVTDNTADNWKHTNDMNKSTVETEEQESIESHRENRIEQDEHLKESDESDYIEEVDKGNEREQIEEDVDSGNEEEEDDGQGWITPGNIKEVKASMSEGDFISGTGVPVGCITTDFAMQNVLIQMGLNVISINGMLIRHARSYVLRCFACMKVTTNMTKEFCPHCGNNTLQKISMSVNQDGTVRYHLSKRKSANTRGLKFSLPMPKGGKHANNPVLCEDQPMPQQRTAKSSKAFDIFSPEYVANSSPFALNDVTSRAAMLGIHGHHGRNRQNVNSSRKRSGRRK